MEPEDLEQRKQISDHELRTDVPSDEAVADPHAMLGYARRFNPEPWTTDETIRELREGDDG
jgi:hypothetical protein